MSLACLFAVFACWWLFTKNAEEVVSPAEPEWKQAFGPQLAVAGGPAVVDAALRIEKKRMKKK
jgi:hypothetical protein